MTIQQYIESINSRYKSGLSTEHTYRGDLQQLIESILPDVKATNEPKRQACGAPDYIITRKDIPIGYIEAKDIGDPDLDGKRKAGNKEQFDRYKASLLNLIFTDYLNFHLYRDGEFVMKIAIGEVTSKGIKPLSENFAAFEDLIKDFGTYIGQTIKSSKKLAEMMAGKARLLANIMEKALTSDEDTQENSTLKNQMKVFREILIHDIEPKSFADIYAQTVAYGLFAARLHDTSLDSFSRQEAAELIPKTNPFLRSLFQYIAGYDIDDKIRWIVDDLALVFKATDMEAIQKDYGKTTKTEDPIIHFYETFLSEYDPALRKSRGVWYTPKPVVNFIIRAVDDILKSEFGLPMGLADVSKTVIKVDVKGKKAEQKVHKVQILDPATGTGTFLAETIRLIYKYIILEGQQGIWSDYVEEQLIPRLNGFELLMASYAMAHLKMDLVLRETGFHSDTNQRFRIYLTNSLEEHHHDTGTLWANWLSTEATEANRVKRDTPVMVVMGNPPYSVSSNNKGEWIENLVADYKRDLNERNIQPLSDDYIKFIRYGQHYIDKNEIGVLAYISNNSFIDGIIHRQMRKNLLESFDKIYILDLHGNAKKKETTPDGGKDENVFDIMQGVSINLFVKTGEKNKLGKVFHFDLYGEREFKYDFLSQNSIYSLGWNKLENIEPNYFFVKKDFVDSDIYETGFKIDDLFKINSTGIKTHRDHLVMDFEKQSLQERIIEFYNLEYTDTEIKKKYNLKDNRDWALSLARKKDSYNPHKIRLIEYRPFDNRFCYYDSSLIDFSRENVMKHLFGENNVGLICPKQVPEKEVSGVFVSKYIAGHKTCSAYNINNIFPLYLYCDTDGQQTLEEQPKRVPNLNMDIVDKIAKNLNLAFLEDDNLECDPPAGVDGSFSPINILDYIYAVLHSPTYREKYKEFLKIDFPRVPYPKDRETFWQLVELGSQLRKIHLMESPVLDQRITRYPEVGDNTVDGPVYENGKVYINKTQYFENVSETVWNFYIGGYQPAQKWLKDRRNRKLSFEDILHYQKIIVALTETDRLMKKIDEIDIA
ncbi:MAG: N-6 DNA methylase [Bacteroidales bacterium]|jgi:predicted helicase|nr:N-6 DNA methylase [Bacteroidales bacterium]